jgi:hypothetical protein
MRDSWVNKGLVVSVILLLIGLAIAPSINLSVVKASNDNDLVEVTTQVCGINGVGNTTMKLTREQYHDLKQYLVEFRAGLNQTTTKEDVVLLFKEAVIELDKYGLLPKGMNVELAQKFISGELLSMKISNFLQHILFIQKKNFDFSDDIINLFCLIYIRGICVYEINIMALIASVFGYIYDMYNLKLFYFLSELVFEYSQLKPLKFMNEIGAISPAYFYYTIGLLGIQNGSDDYYKAYGFSGIKIFLDSGSLEADYIGFALKVIKYT